MIGLIRNELMKIFSRISSWVYIAVLVVGVLAGAIIYQNVYDEPNENFLAETEAEIAQLKGQLEGAEEDEKEYIQIQIDEQQKYVDAGINPTVKTNWHYLNEVVYGLTSLVTLFTVIVCSANVSAEFSDGTIKQLLIRPHRRWSILLSKYISVLLYSFFMLFVLLGAGYLFGMLFIGAGDFDMKSFVFTFEGQKEVAIGSQFFKGILLFLPSLFMIMTISFALSTLFKSQALAVGIGIAVLFGSTVLGSVIVFLAEKFTWVKFLIFPHLDLSIYTIQDTILQDVTISTSLTILLVYYIIFMVLSFLFFQKRDVSI
ncbi:ABC-2 family transporter protein [Bacillus sp. THAF10]|uniref:ABC transporter permease n=1 Tax=Bacillus sp. THAF10 TaxID=2587848 RepID=UPI001269139B|nr:ABC transporter permease [Bacillus sp. THAF10]QFT87743.1 ABC-2 family transporter protein [Bacillus sp. THAF10]